MARIRVGGLESALTHRIWSRRDGASGLSASLAAKVGRASIRSGADGWPALSRRVSCQAWCTSRPGRSLTQERDSLRPLGDPSGLGTEDLGEKARTRRASFITACTFFALATALPVPPDKLVARKSAVGRYAEEFVAPRRGGLGVGDRRERKLGLIALHALDLPESRIPVTAAGPSTGPSRESGRLPQLPSARRIFVVISVKAASRRSAGKLSKGWLGSQRARYLLIFRSGELALTGIQRSSIPLSSAAASK